MPNNDCPIFKMLVKRLRKYLLFGGLFLLVDAVIYVALQGRDQKMEPLVNTSDEQQKVGKSLEQKWNPGETWFEGRKENGGERILMLDKRLVSEENKLDVIGERLRQKYRQESEGSKSKSGLLAKSEANSNAKQQSDSLLYRKYPGLDDKTKQNILNIKSVDKSAPSINKQSTANNKHSSNTKPMIPKIIHQTWDTDEIPNHFVYWIESFLKNHPDWEYWMWTLKDIRLLIETQFPDFLQIYDDYNKDIFRSDAMRYFVLYKFGGIYADLDMKSLKPFDDWIYSHQCILTEETYEHTFVVNELDHTNIVNGFMACRPNHPFYQYAISLLPEFAGRYFGDYLHATGPFFFDQVFQRYKAEHFQNNSSENMTSSQYGLTVVEPKYFLPTFDPSQEGVISYKCVPSKIINLPKRGQEICKALWKRDYKNAPYPESYTDHHWMHVYMFDQAWKTKNTKHLSEIAPNAKDIARVIKSMKPVDGKEL